MYRHAELFRIEICLIFCFIDGGWHSLFFVKLLQYYYLLSSNNLFDKLKQKVKMKKIRINTYYPYSEMTVPVAITAI